MRKIVEVDGRSYRVTEQSVAVFVLRETGDERVSYWRKLKPGAKTAKARLAAGIFK